MGHRHRRLGVVGGMAVDHDGLSGLGTLRTDMRRRMRARWPGLRPVPAQRP
ncbi:hypothetical protein ACFYXN_19920 [Streptomyces griseus]|uniref:hypothetical protein n=1 Tax=Streptomyces griseus TaxID=1911 RepID=UPI00368AAA6A